MQVQHSAIATVTQRIIRHRAEDLRRLADQAEREGVRILLTADGEHLATSRSNPTLLHRVGVDRCNCRGFRVWARCGHHALLLAELGRIPDGDPEPSAVEVRVVRLETVRIPATTRCPSCNGRGCTFVSVPDIARPVSRTCKPCRGVGQVKVAGVVGERELRVVA